MRPVEGVTIVAAVSENNVVGKNGKLPWHIPSDLKRFRDLTMRHVVVMGRTTAESIGSPLQGRYNIVLSSSGRAGFNGDSALAPNVDVRKTPREAMEAAFQKSAEWGKRELFIIGGPRTWKSLMPYVSKILVSRVHAVVDGDMYFPAIPGDFRRVGGLHYPAAEGEAFDVTFESWRRG